MAARFINAPITETPAVRTVTVQVTNYVDPLYVDYTGETSQVNEEEKEYGSAN
jgi:hypothetical protein